MNNLYRHCKGHKIVTLLFVSFASLESAIRVLLIIELTTDLGKSFQKTNLLMMFISHLFHMEIYLLSKHGKHVLQGS